MCITADESLPLLTFSFLEEERNNPNYAILGDIAPWTNHHMEGEIETLKRRFKARCRDILHIFRHYFYFMDRTPDQSGILAQNR